MFSARYMTVIRYDGIVRGSSDKCVSMHRINWMRASNLWSEKNARLYN